MQQITWDDFTRVELRIGTILDAQNFPQARKPAYRLKIDFGEFGILNSSAQLTDNYGCEALVGRQVLAVINFPSKQVANFQSECLTTGIYDADGSVVLLSPDKRVPNGSRLV